MIAIKDMEMPKCCHWDCLLCNEDGGACMLGAYDLKTDTKKERAKDCPLVEDVVERSKIDKAIEEIKQASFNHHFELGEYIGEQTEQWKIVKLDVVLEILKRNIGE